MPHIHRALRLRLRKNVTKGYSDAQIKVRKATSNEAWGPEGVDMAEIAMMTFDQYGGHGYIG
jgi:epsin